MSGEADWLLWSLAAAAAVGCALGWWVWRKGRPFAGGDVFHASRISAGNHLFPTQVLITATSVVQYTPRWLGRQEETIHMAHIASVKIDTGLLLSNVLIETSGGVSPIACHGHRKGDAVQMKNLIERYQNDYYRGHAAPVGTEPIGR
ncbi:MAG: hypothetical protein A3F69_02670 [Acidobacteria bacterium RIFCSPLOWO2_12_FULL_66_10]|nr:MAG: hypothetical protein A3F69_02670 [Acidobacteria bacterium RIFCSPLOWO2_12_FULL_66_10]